MSLAAAAAVGTSTPRGLALVLGVPSLGIFLVRQALPCLAASPQLERTAYLTHPT